MVEKKRILKFLFIITGILFLILVSSLFIPAVQKHLVKTQLTPWISHVSVDYIHITPFSIQIDNFAFKYQAIDIHIGHLNSEFSPFQLFNQRIKIDKLVLKKLLIDDFSLASNEKNDSTLLFPGLFPYLDSGYIYDIGHLDIQADYHSPGTGLIQLGLTAQSVNEKSPNPLKLQIIAKELQDVPDIQELYLDASIALNQYNNHAIDAHKSSFDFKLVNQEGMTHFLALQLAMKQAALPELWDSFPFDKNRHHYLKKILHPESIELQVIHSNQHRDILSDIHLNGEYDGNEGILTGTVKVHTDKEFLSLFKSLQLPKIESDLNASFQYNTRSLQGHIDLYDKFQVENLAGTDNRSLPEQIELSNHIIARIDKQHIVINRFLLDIFNAGREYIKIFTHKPLSIDLDNLAAFLEQQKSDLLTINISHIPLNWFNDFIAGYHFDNGFLDTDINLSIADKTLMLKTNRPLSLTELTLLEDTQETEQNSKDPNNTKIPLLAAQNLNAVFTITANQENLLADISQLELFQTNTNKELKAAPRQVSTSITLNLQHPLDKQFIRNPVTIKSKGHFNINEIVKIPLLDTLTNETLSLTSALPKSLSLNYDVSFQGKSLQDASSLWTVNKTHIVLKSEKYKNILQISNHQTIQLKQNKDKLVLQTTGELLSGQINQFDLNWLSPVIKQYAEPYKLSGQLGKMDFTLSAKGNNDYFLDIKQLKFNNLQTYKDQQLLFKNIQLNTKIQSRYTEEKLTVHYPVFSIKQNKNILFEKSGSMIIDHPGIAEKQQISMSGKLNGHINRIMNLSFVSQYTQKKMQHQSRLNAKYKLSVKNNQLTISQTDIQVTHPQSKGQLSVKIHKPISLSLQDKKHAFSQNGHLSFNLSNFDIKPYESIFTDLPITFDHISGHIDLIQQKKKQTITLQQPITIHNIHFKESSKALLNPFDITLDFKANQYKNITDGEIKDFSIAFLNGTLKIKDKNRKNNMEKALDLKAHFKLDLDKAIILSELNGNLDLSITQWLNQPAVMPHNTLTQGTLNTRFSLDKHKNIKHNWSINNLIDQQGKKIVESISIDGTGHLKSLSDFKLDLPIVMKSLSGETLVNVKTHIELLKDKKKLSMNLDGKEIFLNDLLKLLAAINPQSEIAKIESADEAGTKQDNKQIDRTPAASPFWQSGMDISARLNIDTLYYSDYMSYQDIKGELDIDDKQLNARNFSIKFHDSPMNLNALLQFKKGQERPYDIDFKTSLSHFNIGSFLRELNKNHVPRADGVFDVDIKIYGGLSNLSQFRNELLFDLSIEGEKGVYHLIPADDVMTRSGGAVMAVVGEVVSVLPTSGFGLGIINRVVRFAKDIDYDFISMHLVRQSDLNTRIEQFRILSPELHFFASGGITFKENTRVFDQPLAMDAQINLAGEGAAIFYGLGLLTKEQDQFGFWKGPVINFTGTLNHQNDNFDEIISKAKKGTLLGGVTNPFSGLVGNWRYRWFGNSPDYSNLDEQHSEPSAVPDKKIPTENISHPQAPSFFDETF